MYNLLHTSQRERQVRSLQSTLKSFYFHDRNVTRKKKNPMEKSQSRMKLQHKSLAAWVGEKRGQSIRRREERVGITWGREHPGRWHQIAERSSLDGRGTVVSLVTVVKARNRATRGSPGVLQHWWAQRLCSAGLRALEQWPGAQSSCITRQKKMAHQPFLQQNPLDGHNRMQRMPCLTGTLGHAGFKSPFYYHGHCS